MFELVPDRAPIASVRISSVGDLIATVPALLGFHPDHSLVTVLLDERNRVVCTIRTDLTGGVQTDRIIDIAARAGADHMVLVVYAPRTSGALPLADELALAMGLMSEAVVRVSDAFAVDAGRFWSYLCQDSSCCPPQGTAIPTTVSDLETHKIASGALAVAESRDALTAIYRPYPELAPPPGVYRAQRRAQRLPLRTRCGQAVTDTLALSSWLAQDSSEVDCDAVRARLGLLLTDVVVRDYLLATLVRDQPDLAPIGRALTWLALTASDEYRPALAATAAAMVIALGDNPVAAWGLLDLAEGVPLAALLARCLQGGFPPDRLRGLLVDALPAVEGQINAS